MALSQCIDCISLVTVKDDAGKFLYRCKLNKVVNKATNCPFFVLKG